MKILNVLVFITLFIIGNIIIFKGPFQNLINAAGTTNYQKSDKIVESKGPSIIYVSIRAATQRAKFARKVHKPPLGVNVINF
jgi:hypothetical protein